MYLSKLVLNPRSRAVQADLGNCQGMHRTLMKAFPAVAGVEARAQLGVLYRVETDHRTGGIALLVQSRVEPAWAALPDEYVLGRPAWKDVSELYGRILEGSVLQFRLLANPTKKVDTKSGPDGERRNGRRVELTDEQQQIRWLERKAAQAGFGLLGLGITGKGPLHETVGRHPAGKVVVKGVLFEGRLVVADVKRFQAAVQGGLGPGKAYGFGLLSVAPARG